MKIGAKFDEILLKNRDFCRNFRTFPGSFAAVSTPIFASKASFFSVKLFRALHFFPLHRSSVMFENMKKLDKTFAKILSFERCKGVTIL